jgi:hypothetical protein
MTRSGVTFIEIIVVCVLAVPLMLVSWNALIGARQAESATAVGAAVRGASILERYLRRDLASVDVGQGAAACTTADDSITLALCIPKSTPNLPLMERVTRSYKLEGLDSASPPTAYAVYRDGRRLAGVVVESMHATIIGTHTDAWIKVEVTALDPSLAKTKQGELVKHATTILAPLPPPFDPSFLVDYSLWPPQ